MKTLSLCINTLKRIFGKKPDREETRIRCGWGFDRGAEEAFNPSDYEVLSPKPQERLELSIDELMDRPLIIRKKKRPDSNINIRFLLL